MRDLNVIIQGPAENGCLQTFSVCRGFLTVTQNSEASKKIKWLPDNFKWQNLYTDNTLGEKGYYSNIQRTFQIEQNASSAILKWQKPYVSHKMRDKHELWP